MPFNLKEIWAIRIRLQMEMRVRELALSVEHVNPIEDCVGSRPASNQEDVDDLFASRITVLVLANAAANH